ncbi:serine/threonine protein kinase, partial [Streptomonospora algeriensis]
TRAAGQGGAEATSVMGTGAGEAERTSQYPPPYHPDGRQASPSAGYGQHTRAYDQQGPAPTAAHGAGSQQTPPTAAMPPARDDAYEGMYRGFGGTHDTERQRQEQQRRQQQEQQRRQQQEEEQQREEQRRRQEAERVHRERVRAEQEAARRAQASARQANQPGLWSFVKLLPLLIIPIIQIPLGTGVSYAWQWFTSESGMWNGTAWFYPGVFTFEGFFHAMYLGYFLLNNVVGAEFLIRSLRTAYVVGAMLAIAVIAGTNGMLFYYGFWG